MNLTQRLDAVISKHDLLQHPFYRAWSAGKLDLPTLRYYATQYYAQVAAFPRFVSSVHSRCPELPARKVLLENLVDEELHGTDHPSLWLQFAEGLGATADEVRVAEHAPETRASVNELFALTEGPWTEGLCALYAYEKQVPAVSASKIEGLKAYYGIADARSLAFFTAHMKYDVEHARAVGELIDRHASPERAEEVTARASKALETFLDGVCRERHVDC